MDKTAKKTTPAAPGKKKVIRRLVKNAKTGEIIKTEIVRIDSSGERTVTSYPAGTPVPSLSSLQSQNSQVRKTSTRKPSVEAKPPSPSTRRPSREDSTASVTDPETQAGSAPSLSDDTKPKPHAVVNKNEQMLDEVGPSVPTNVPGLEDLIKKEEEMRRMSESGLDRHEKPKAKSGEESLETALISIMRKKRQRDPKARRRGLVASTMARRTSDDELDKALDDAYEDTDYRTMHSKKDENQEDEEAEKKRKERHRRRKEKKQKERSQVDRDDVEEYEGETGPLNLPEIDSYRKRDEETPMDGVENKIPESGAEREEEELSKKLEDTTIKPEGEAGGEDQPSNEKDEEETGSDDDKKKKKKKHKHKKKKKKAKKQKKRASKSGSEKEDEKDERGRKKSKSKSRSRSRSLSSLSMSSISSAFSDGFDFAGMNFDPSEDGGFDKALIEYQQMKEQVIGSQFAGRGFDPFFRGRGGFPRGRGFPGGRFPGPFPGPPWGGPGPMFHFYQPDPNFMFPGGMGPDGEKGRGRGVPASQGPWRGRGLRGRGVPPGFHRNYTEDDQGDGLYVEDSGSSSSDSGRKKKKKKHRRRSYSSSSYSSSGSSRSRSRSRRRHRRRHRSSSYSSRSSRSYSRSSYSSRSYRSYSRSSRSSYSKSSYSRSRSRSTRRSRSQSREASRKPYGYDDADRRASPSYHAYDEDGFKPPVRGHHSDDEEVPWWAEFDKTYEVEKKKLEEEKKKLEEEEKAITGEGKEPQPPSIVSTDEIDVVRCVMTLVDKARAQQDEIVESARECINDIITKITTTPVQATQLHEEVEDPFDKVIHDCVDSILDRVCPNDPQTAARLCLKEIIDTVVEQEEEDKANEEATEMEKEITESSQSKLYQCYLKAQKLTEQIKAERRTKGLTDETAGKDDNEDGKGKGDDRKRDKRGHRSRHRRRSRSRDRGRRRRRHTSSDSRSSSRSSDARIPLVSKESLQQAQAVLMMQQQQLQVAGLLGTGMPNLAGLNQAAALAAGITPALLAQTGLKSTDLPSLTGEKPAEKAVEESSKFTKWDKDKDAMSKKDDLTRKLMQRMREKKLKQEEDDESTTFQSRNKEKTGDVATTDKVFSGPTSLKSRKIAISSTFGKLWSKVEGSPKRDDDGADNKIEIKGYNKSDIVAATAEGKDQMQPSAERLKAEEQEKKLAAWSDEQAKLKEAAKREMREQIERAERAKKEQMKEEILEQERQKEIMRIREEVRSQIRKEIQEEIEKQRKSVLEDPAVRGKLLELEALRSQSGLISNDNVSSTVPSSSIPSSTASASPAIAGATQMRDQRWYQQQMKNKQDMQKWMEGHGYYEAEMDDATMKRMQMTYMQNWTPAQKQGYMRWYWQQKQYPGSPYYPQRQQHMMGQRPLPASQGSAIPQLMRSRPQQSEFPSPDMVFTRAPSQPQHPQQRALPGHRVPFAQMAPQSMPPSMMGRPRASGSMERHGIPGQGYQNQRPSHPPPRYHETERPSLDYSHEMRYHPRQQQPPLNVPQQGQKGPIQAQLQENRTEAEKTVDQAEPNQISTKAPTTPMQQPQPQVDQPPLHQYPPPGLEEEEQSPVAVPPLVPPQALRNQVPVVGQPPPPGESSLEKPGAAGVDALGPPGEEVDPAVVSHGMQDIGDDDSPSKSKKKKKQKKHRKHKKKKYSSSDEEEDVDPEAEKAAILAQLQDLKDVEDGEIASDDGSAAVKELPKETKKKKKHKKEKKKHKKRRDDSSEEEKEAQVPQPIPTHGGMPAPTGFYPPPGQIRPPFDMPTRPGFPGAMPGEHRPNNFPPPPHSAAERFGQYPPPTAPFLGDRERPGFLPHSRDHRGAGEPQHMVHRPEKHQPPMGPGGDHNPPQRKRSPSPLPLVIPTDPQEFELWQKKMEARYNDSDPKKPTDLGRHPDSSVSMDQQLLKDIEAVRRRQGERDLPVDANEDVIMMMRMMDEEQRRQRPGHHDRPLRDGRKRGHGHMSRGGRKRQRRLPRRNYHDWDKPEDDGLIYCQSGSDSSDWGSDTNMDFDKMLAKKRKEAEKRDNLPLQSTVPHQTRSPGRMMGWDRREIPSRKEDLLQGEKPQGIPVIGGGPRPIPTNVSSGRPTQHHHPDMIGGHGGLDFMSPDVVKLPTFPPTSYPHDPHLMDQRRDPGFPPPPMPPSAHPIPRLGQGAPPIPHMMLNPPLQPRMHHHMDFRPRYPM